MAVRKGARFLAPLALAAAVAGTYLIVHQTLRPSKRATATTQSTSLTAPPVTHTRKGHRPPRVYVVRSGDTLSGISAKTGVSLTTIKALNPSLDPNALQVGRHIRLR
jgi:LysM repeat protein